MNKQEELNRLIRTITECLPGDVSLDLVASAFMAILAEASVAFDISHDQLKKETISTLDFYLNHSISRRKNHGRDTEDEQI